MPVVSLPDGSHRSFDGPVSIYDIAADIGPGLARAALAGVVDGVLVDTSHRVEDDASVRIVTERDAEGLEVIRHSTAHLLAQAVKQLHPEAQVTIGPVIDDGFFYDFSYPRGFGPDDLVAIEQRMGELRKQALPVTREVLGRDQAVALFRDMGEDYKAEIIGSIPAGDELSLYRQGDFVDLCRGPHVPDTGRLKAFKLTKVAGAYWRGNSDNEMLQRIYGTAWTDKKALKAYLKRIEEAEKRDHRKIGRQLDLFHLQEEAPGMVFWHDKGWTLYREVENYVRNVLLEYDYQEVKTPQIVDRSLWEKSGHWENFGDLIFTLRIDDRDFAIKPMNCPCHVQIYNQGLKSYRDLPLRLAEFGSCHRNEPSGTRHGIMRVRNFVQDDAHIFCTEDQIQSEVATLIDLVFRMYGDFGFHDIAIKLSTRPEKRVGSDVAWDKAEDALDQALRGKGLDFQIDEGEGAFYGPKVDFFLTDSLQRVWQCGTIQVDFMMPGRLDAQYVTETGDRKVPVMIHRAILGSLERFIGILIEEHEGKFPTWLAPVQAVIMSITDEQSEYAQECTKTLRNQGFRAISDLRNEKIGLKIREHTLQRIPYLLVVGGREVENSTLAVRTRAGEDLGVKGVDAIAEMLRHDIASRGQLHLEG